MEFWAIGTSNFHFMSGKNCLKFKCLSKNDTMSHLTVVQLKAEAKTRGLHGYSNKSKSELLAMLGYPTERPTREELLAELKAKGIAGGTGKSKAVILEMVKAPPPPPLDAYSQMTRPELMNELKALYVKGFSHMKRDELVKLLKETDEKYHITRK